jgi:hypothetical protein
LSHLVPGAAIRVVDAVLPCGGCGNTNQIVLAPSRLRTAFRLRVTSDLRRILDLGTPMALEVLYDGGAWVRVNVRLDTVEEIARQGRVRLTVEGVVLELPVIGGPEDPQP